MTEWMNEWTNERMNEWMNMIIINLSKEFILRLFRVTTQALPAQARANFVLKTLSEWMNEWMNMIIINLSKEFI